VHTFSTVVSHGIWYVLIYLLRQLDQEKANLPFWSSSQAATCYYQSNHSKVEAALPKDTTSEPADLFSREKVHETLLI